MSDRQTVRLEPFTCPHTRVATEEITGGRWLECEACRSFWYEPDYEPADAGGYPGDAEGGRDGDDSRRLPAGAGDELDDTPSQLALF